jgi:hypothetical protein
LVTCTSAGRAVATTAVRLEKAESTAMFRPDGDVPVVSVGGGLVLDSFEPPQARAATAAATRTSGVRVRLGIPPINLFRLVRARLGVERSLTLAYARC